MKSLPYGLDSIFLIYYELIFLFLHFINKIIRTTNDTNFIIVKSTTNFITIKLFLI